MILKYQYITSDTFIAVLMLPWKIQELFNGKYIIFLFLHSESPKDIYYWSCITRLNAAVIVN